MINIQVFFHFKDQYQLNPSKHIPVKSIILIFSFVLIEWIVTLVDKHQVQIYFMTDYKFMQNSIIIMLKI